MSLRSYKRLSPLLYCIYLIYILMLLGFNHFRFQTIIDLKLCYIYHNSKRFIFSLGMGSSYSRISTYHVHSIWKDNDCSFLCVSRLPYVSNYDRAWRLFCMINNQKIQCTVYLFFLILSYLYLLSYYSSKVEF